MPANHTRQLKINLNETTWAQVEQFVKDHGGTADSVVATFAELWSEERHRRGFDAPSQSVTRLETSPGQNVPALST